MLPRESRRITMTITIESPSTDSVSVRRSAAGQWNRGRLASLLISIAIVPCACGGAGTDAAPPPRFAPQPPIVETFDTVAMRASQIGAIAWEGTGSVTATSGFELIGNGSFGPMDFGPGRHTLDSGIAPVPAAGQTFAFDEGTWHVTDLRVRAGATVRGIGRYPITIRCRGRAEIAGTIDVSAGSDSMAPLGSPEQGPRNGAVSNGSGPGNAIVHGGVGGPGAGRGGHASQLGYTVRTTKAESGFGPAIEGLPNPGPGSFRNSYGGGEGGGANVHGSGGGAGGSAAESGQNAVPIRHSLLPFPPVCVPAPVPASPPPPPLPPIALAPPAVPTSIAPLTVFHAGSGGGGGGDRFGLAGPSTDPQGGGGGGGGGALRIAAWGDIDLAPTCRLLAEGVSGGHGAAAPPLWAGDGGAGSGGTIWLRSLGAIRVAFQARLSSRPGAGNECTRPGPGGAGGPGPTVLEDRDGYVNTSFAGIYGLGSSVTTLMIDRSTATSGSLTSRFYDLQTEATRFHPDDIRLDIESGSSGRVAVTFQAAHANAVTGRVDPTSITSAVSLGGIGALSGHRFIRFSVAMEYDLPFARTPAPTPPMLREVSIGYRASR